MTLNITVGLLSDLDEEDEDIVQEELHFLEEVNAALRERGLPEHHEPLEPPEGFEFWSATIGSSDLEELLGLAVTVADSSAEEAAERFPHLVGTQCSYFLPLDFAEPLLFEIEDEEDDDEEENYELDFEAPEEEGEEDVEEEEDYLIGVGSSVQLKNELAAIALAVDLPLNNFAVDFSGESGAEAWDEMFEQLRQKKAKCVEVESASRALINLYHACQLAEKYQMTVCLG